MVHQPAKGPRPGVRARDRMTAGALVTAQFACLAALLLPDGRAKSRARRSAVRAGGAALLLAGGGGFALAAATDLGPALTPSPLPARGAQLRSAGAYGVVRHPVYAGLILAAVGRALGSGAPRHTGAALALTALLRVKAGYEERWLVERYAGYAAYAARTPRLAPSPARALASRRRTACGS